MAERGNNDKSNKTLRAYLVYDYIFKRAESERFTPSGINAYLEAYGINCDNRAIIRDIEAINQAYIMLQKELNDVVDANKALENISNQLIIRDDVWGGYRINKESFKIADISLIAECIGAARFVNEKDKEKLINIVTRSLHPKDVEKIKDAVSGIQREKIHGGRVYDNLKRIIAIFNSNDEYKCCDALQFEYQTYNVGTLGKSKIGYKTEEFVVFPHKIINSNGLHHLLAYDTKKRQMRFFRIDRMSCVSEYYNETRHGIRTVEKMDLSTLVARTFDMCMGEDMRVTMRFANALFDEVYERFGKDDVFYLRCDDAHFEVSLMLNVSPKFFGWLCSFGKDAKLISPPTLIEEFSNYIDGIKNQY